MLGQRPEAYSADDWRSLREGLRLSVLYPGRYVAFRDHYQGEGPSRRLVRREVVHSSRSLAAVNKRIDSLPEKERPNICIDYVEPSEARARGR
jgi:hypothetical protein